MLCILVTCCYTLKLTPNLAIWNNQCLSSHLFFWGQKRRILAGLFWLSVSHGITSQVATRVCGLSEDSSWPGRSALRNHSWGCSWPQCLFCLGWRALFSQHGLLRGVCCWHVAGFLIDNPRKSVPHSLLWPSPALHVVILHLFVLIDIQDCSSVHTQRGRDYSRWIPRIRDHQGSFIS